jgi:DnaJ-domain-containing protein 1
MAYFLIGLFTLGTMIVLARWYVQASTHDLVQGARTFVAVFSALASTGLLFTGRFGLAFITIAATIMAIRAIRQGARGADPMDGGGGPASDPVEVETDLLRMQLDRASGDVKGAVKTGPFAGRDLGSLGRDELLALLAEAQGVDAQSASLLEAYLDRRFPDWREPAAGRSGGGGWGRQQESGRGRDRASSSGSGDMDEAEALEVLGLERGAAPEEIKQAHRRLMAKLHPDSGGSNFLATQINRAKDILLGKVGSKRR